MTRRGPAPATIEEKLRRGNPGKRSLPRPSRAVDPITVNDWDAPTPVVLDRLLDAGVPWIAQSDLPLVVLARDAIADLADLYADPRVKPSAVQAQQRVVVEVLAELGLTPVARGRVGLAVIKGAHR